jgi:hypothetical protein
VSYPSDPALTGQQRESRYSYWPVNFALGNLTVISNMPLPLSGVAFSKAMREVGELRASLQLADDSVRKLYPWDKIVPRKTALVVVREERTPSGQWVSQALDSYTVYAAPSSPATGRMEIVAHSTVEAQFARRLITRAMTWNLQDQTTIAADLCDPAKFSLLPLGASPWPGWVTVDPPTAPTGVARTHSYEEGQETNLLEAHQARSQLATNSYEWTTGLRILSGSTATSAQAFRPVYVMGFPMLGRRRTADFPMPVLTYDREGRGNVLSFDVRRDGTGVPNVVWGRGDGYEDLQIKDKIENVDQYGKREWEYGYLQSEERLSNPDVSNVSTLRDHMYRLMWDRLGSERYLAKVTVRGDLPPYFGSYVIGDDLLIRTNDPTWPPDWYEAGWVYLPGRIYGWTVRPPQGDQSEQIELLVGGGLPV